MGRQPTCDDAWHDGGSEASWEAAEAPSKRPRHTLTGAEDAEEFAVPVCQHFLWGMCFHGDQCWMSHAGEPKKWTAEDDAAWEAAGWVAPDAEDAGTWKPSSELKEEAAVPVCQHFLWGTCNHGDRCWKSHTGEPRQWTTEECAAWEAEDAGTCEPNTETKKRLPPWWDSAGLRFVVGPPSCDSPCDSRCTLGSANGSGDGPDTGSMRLRLIGSIEALGGWNGREDEADGVDLLWEGDCWASAVVLAPPGEIVGFNVLRLKQNECHPGTLQGNRRLEVHGSRRFTRGARHTVLAPAAGEIIEVCISPPPSCLSSAAPSPNLSEPQPRSRCPGLLVEASGQEPAGLRPAPAPGRQRSYTFGASNGVSLNFCLYVPPGFGGPPPRKEGWPLLVFLHSMHGRLDGDNNLFYESDGIPRLLCGDPRCPAALRDGFVVVSPQCPIDPNRGDGGGVWLRYGWFETSEYADDLEAALAALLRSLLGTLDLDPCRLLMSGASMGGYAALELATRWPGTFAAVALVAAHYELEPPELTVERLSIPQSLPLWFFHAREDSMCPFEPMEDLVQRLKQRSKADVRLTAFEDTWSNTGHCADRVAYWARGAELSPDPCPGAARMGDELFEWLLQQRGAGVLPLVEKPSDA